MNLTITDTASNELRAKIAKLEGAQRMEILRACGTKIMAMAKTAIKEPSQRPAPWPPLKASTLKRRKAKGHHGTAPLRASGALFRSIRVTSLTSNSVEVSTDRPYARIQQFGGNINIPGFVMRPKNAKALFWPGAKHPVKSVKMPPRTVTIPARPYMPLTASGQLTTAAKNSMQRIVEEKVSQIFR